MKTNDSQFQLPTEERVSQFMDENETKQTGPTDVKMKKLLESKEFKETDAALPIILGTTDDGKPYVADLASIPHLLIGGKTGYGKFICVMNIITSLLHKKHPEEFKFVLFDPKMVKFSHFDSIENQYLAKLPGETPIVSDIDKVMPTLNSLLKEMDNRLRILRDAKVKNLTEYNSLLKSGKLNPEASQTPMPYLVVIVEELADHMLTIGSEANNAYSRLALKGKAAGIHLILATNYPSARIFTGDIKTSIPGRIAFRVDTGYESRTLIDSKDAQDLVKLGEIIFVNLPEKKHLQIGYISQEEERELCDYIAAQPFTGKEPYLLPTPIESEKETPKNKIEDSVTTVLIVCLDGTDDALHHAYRSSIRMLADFSMEFGDEGEPGYLDFKWEFIDKYRVLTVRTDGAGFNHDFSRIPGISECLWVLYDENAGIYCSNDTKGEILNRKELFGIPEAEYEVDGESVSEVAGSIGWSPVNPDILETYAPEDLPF